MPRGVTSLSGSVTSTAKQVQQRLNRFEAQLASTADNLGASLVGIEDAGSLLTATTVEAALQELASGIGITDVSAAAATELTIAAGVVTATQTYHTIDTEGDAASDDLDTINGLADGQFYVFKSAAAARNVVFKHGTGNIINPSGRDITLDVLNDKIFGFSNGTSLFVLDMSLATPTGGGLASALASVSASQGASLVGVQDSGALYTATTVEAALAESRTTTLAKAATELTIAAGAITLTQTYHTIDTEADAASDDLDTVNGIVDGATYWFRNAAVGRAVVFKSGVASIICPGNFDVTMTAAGDTVLGFGYGGFLVVIPFVLASLAGGGLGAALASSANGQGASRVSIEDAGGSFTNTTVEGAFTELGPERGSATVADPGNAGAISVVRSGAVAIVSAGAETRTLAIPTFIGQELSIYFQTDGGDCVITVASAINQAGNTIITLNDVDDSILLKGVWNGVARAWRVVQNDGPTLS